MEATVSRQMLRTLEPVHGMIYFVREAADAYERVGLRGRRMGYFASRAAAMGPVSSATVVATFFNFFPPLVERVIPEAWTLATPEAIVAARYEAADAALRRLLGDAVHGADINEAAELAREAARGCTPEGRPLYAAHAGVAWPDEPHMVLWHAQTLLREFRGDGHIAAMVTEDITGPEALVIHAATGEVSATALQTSRAWPDAEWAAAVELVRARGWIEADGSFTAAGRASREWVEGRTDALMLRCWDRIGEDGCQRLRELVRPHSRAIAQQALHFSLVNWDD